LKIASLLVLVIGLGVAAGIYFSAPAQDENMAMYEMAASKQYNRQLQRFGGKASVLFDEIQTWFAARWQGRQLGVTIGWISVGAALVLYFAARRR
jgi:hypothetical protein